MLGIAGFLLDLCIEGNWVVWLGVMGFAGYLDRSAIDFTGLPVWDEAEGNASMYLVVFEYPDPVMVVNCFSPILGFIVILCVLISVSWQSFSLYLWLGPESILI